MTDKLIKDIVQWDVRSWSKAIRYWDESVDWDKVENVLELGGREGGLSLWLALKNKKVICSDLKRVQQTAEPLHSRYDVSSFISYQSIDATSIPYENHFDLIVFKSIIGGIGRDSSQAEQKIAQQKAFTEIYKALKPGGKLLFAENLIASPLHQAVRKRFVNWKHYWHYVSIGEMKKYLSAFKSYELKTTGVLGTFGRNEAQKKALAAIDNLILNRIIPDRWKYISYGIAEK